MKYTIVYSALHTGTKFTCRALINNAEEICEYRIDRYIRDVHGYTIEDLINGNQVTYSNINSLIEGFYKGFSYLDMLIFQAHQRTEGTLYRALLGKKPEVPVVVPMRDPLLSLNTRIWRECGNLEVFLRNSIEHRKARAYDQLNSIKRLLDIPAHNIFILPIDIDYTPNKRIDIFNNLINYTGLTPNKRIKDNAVAWTPIAPTASGYFAQRDEYKIEEEHFNSIKQSIITGDIVTTQKYLSIELQVIQEILGSYKDKLKSIGYNDLIWW